jgi:hypothetical protein
LISLIVRFLSLVVRFELSYLSLRLCVCVDLLHGSSVAELCSAPREIDFEENKTK